MCTGKQQQQQKSVKVWDVLVFTLQQQPLRLPERRHRLVAVSVVVAAGARFLLQASVPANGGRIGVVVVEAVSSTDALVVAVAEKGISIWQIMRGREELE